MAKKKSRTRKKNTSIKPIPTELKAVLLLILSAISFASLIFTDQTGVLGRFIYQFFGLLAGERAFTLPIFIAVLGGNLLYKKNMSVSNRFYGLILIILLVIVIRHIELVLQADLMSRGEVVSISWNLAMTQSGGGFIGALFSIVLLLILGEIGTLILLVSLGFVSFLLLTNTTLTEGFGNLKELSKKLWEYVLIINEQLHNIYQRLINVKQKRQSYNQRTEGEDDQANLLSLDDYRRNHNEDASPSFYSESQETPIIGNDLSDTPNDQTKQSITNTYNGNHESNLDVHGSKDEPGDSQMGERNSDAQTPEKGDKVTYKFNPSQENDFKTYQLPSLALLKQSKKVTNERVNRKELTDKAWLLEETLSSFGVQARVIKVQQGPTITRYELQPEKGVKVSKIVNLSDDLALSMAAPEVRIEAPIPGKAAIGIEVPNHVVTPVYLREVLESSKFQQSPSPLTLGIGKDIAGEPVVADLGKMPHLLIAGATGSGKSVSINSIITSILFKASPEDVKLLLVDPKVVELKVFDGLPHLIAPVVTDPKNASTALKNVVAEMELRYRIFAESGVRDITKYNRLNKKGQDLPDKLPYIVVIIDELADLMMVAPTEIEDAIFRLAQMSRAAGIHLVLATQRPSVDVITGVIKSNITTRIAFAVTSQADSRTILDMGGAEKLLGQGDMLFTPVGNNKPTRLQGAYISDKEVEGMVEFVKKQGEPQYNETIISENNAGAASTHHDELLPKAVQLVAETEQASISLIQRRLRVGYTRAARLVDELESFGVIRGHEGSKPRRIIMNKADLQSLLEKLN